MRVAVPVVSLLLFGAGCTDELDLRAPDGGIREFPLPHGPLPTITPDTGDGLEGPLDVAIGSVVVNVCQRLSSTSGSVAVVDSADTFQTGRRVLLLQMQDGDAASGATSSTAPPGGAGAFEWATVTSVLSTALAFTADLTGSYESDVDSAAELCTLPQFESVTIGAGATVAAAAWDGNRGGVVAFFSRTTVVLAGSLSAQAGGFRGGLVLGSGSINDVILMDTSSDLGGGKGEGAVRRSRDLFGRGAIANAGGGGNSNNGAGGGGGGAGAGGLGGYRPSNVPETAGYAGGSLADPDGTMLLSGGGGGAGQQNQTTAGPGGIGGGVVLVFGDTLAGNGTVLAGGGAGGFSDNDGAGGGGGGGTIRLELRSAAGFTGSIRANGGIGGDVQNMQHPPGGGGGGGRVRIPADCLSTPDTSGGLAGVNVESGLQHGATAGQSP